MSADGKIGGHDASEIRRAFVRQFPDLFASEYTATLQQAPFCPTLRSWRNCSHRKITTRRRKSWRVTRVPSALSLDSAWCWVVDRTRGTSDMQWLFGERAG